MQIGNKQFVREEIEKRVGNLSQLGGLRHYELTEGSSKNVRAVDFDSASGFSFTVLPDRAMDISRTNFQGGNLSYLSPNGETNPAFYASTGSEWLRSFFGGLLTTCGLTNFGPPDKDDNEELGLHGKDFQYPSQEGC